MTEIYGHKWVSSFGETDMDDTWARGLHDMTNTELSIGLQMCLVREDSWPPTLPEFIKLCRAKQNKPVYHYLYEELPTPTLTKEEKLAHIARIRESLK